MSGHNSVVGHTVLFLDPSRSLLRFLWLPPYWFTGVSIMWPAISISLIVERDVKPEGHVSFLPHTRSRHPMIVEFLDQHLSLSWHCGLWFGFSPKRVFSKIVFSATFLFLFFLHHNCGRRYMITLVWLWLCLSVYLCLYACRLCLGCLVIKIWKCSWPIFMQFG